MFVPSTNMLSSLPTQHNGFPIVTCFGVTTLHPIFTLQPNHISMDCNVLHLFSKSPPSMKTNKVFFSSCFCTTIGSMVIYSYCSPVMISEFINTRDNACSLANSIIKTMALWLLSIFRIRGMPTVDNVNIITISEIKLIETVSDMYYNYFSQDYLKCTDTDTIWTNGINYPTELIMLLKYLKVAE